MTEYTPCPTCQQYSHSIGEDRVTEAFNHFQSMSAMPIQNAFDEQTRDAAQVLMAEIERLREALEYYAKDHKWPNEGPWGADSGDFGLVARKALHG